VQGWFNIGVLHTSCDGRPGHAVYAPCTVDDLARRGYQYWALGHVHEYEELARDPWIVFPGNLQGRSVRECGPKGAVLVEVDDGRVIAVERLILDRARWAVLTVDVSDIDDETFALRKIEEAIQPVAEQAEGRLLALRVRLAGESGLHRRLKAEPHRFSDEIQAAAQRCHEDIWLERLRVETTDAARSHATDEGVPSIDLSAMLHGIEDDPAVRSAAADLISMVVGKIPGGITTEETTLGGNLDALLAEAQAVILGRVKG
jgi:DNA repair exonuclease SbcCD nuclease subunit